MATCAACGEEIPLGHEVVLKGKSEGAPPVTLCSNCAKAAEKGLKAETERPNLVSALLLGLGAAVIYSIVWYGIAAMVYSQLHFVAAGIGWLVGIAISSRATAKDNLLLQAISVLITLIALVLSECFIVRYFYVQSLIAEGYTGIPLLLPLGTMARFVTVSIRREPLTLLFWGIAALGAFIMPAKRRLRRA